MSTPDETDTTEQVINYLSVDDLLDLYVDIPPSEESGEKPLTENDLRTMQRDDALRECLESQLSRQRTAAYYEGADVVMQAAILMHGISTRHCFGDRNKRMASKAGFVFLLINGYLLEAGDGELSAWILALLGFRSTNEGYVSTTKMSVEVLAELLRSRL